MSLYQKRSAASSRSSSMSVSIEGAIEEAFDFLNTEDTLDEEDEDRAALEEEAKTSPAQVKKYGLNLEYHVVFQDSFCSIFFMLFEIFVLRVVQHHSWTFDVLCFLVLQIIFYFNYLTEVEFYYFTWLLKICGPNWANLVNIIFSYFELKVNNKLRQVCRSKQLKLFSKCLKM